MTTEQADKLIFLLERITRILELPSVRFPVLNDDQPLTANTKKGADYASSQD